MPLLGVCLGHQAIGAAFGGQVVRAKNLMHGKTSAGRARRQDHLPRPVFSHDRDPLSLADRRRKRSPDDLEVSAWTHDSDGTRVIMGLRHQKFPVEGVQFHPESVLTGEGKKLVANFLRG